MRDCPTWPEWLPSLVAEHAILVWRQAEAAGNVEEANALERMTSDPRMEAVWNYLQRRRRDPDKRHVRTHLYDHVARDADPNADNPAPSKFPIRSEALQQLAMRRLYGDMVRLVRLYGLPSGVVARAHPAMFPSKQAQRRIAALRAEADTITEGPARARRKVQHALLAAASAREELAQAVADGARQGLPTAIATLIARKLFRYFVGARENSAGGLLGDYMPAQAAVIASVILNTTIAASAVEYALDVREVG
jgi:hypothetical protein